MNRATWFGFCVGTVIIVGIIWRIERTSRVDEIQRLQNDNKHLNLKIELGEKRLETYRRGFNTKPDPNTCSNISKTENFLKMLENYTRYHNDVTSGRLPPRYVECVLINGWGNVFQEAVSCFLYALVTNKAAIMNVQNTLWYMPYFDFIPRDSMPFDGYNTDLLVGHEGVQVTRYDLPCLDPKQHENVSKVVLQLTYDWFAPMLLVNPYFGEDLAEILPANYFQLIFHYLFKLRGEMLEEVERFKREKLGPYNVGIQIRYPKLNKDGEKDHKGFPVPPLDLYAQTAELLSRFQTQVPYKDVTWFMATQEVRLSERLQSYYGDKVVWYNGTISTTFDGDKEGQRVSMITWWLLGEMDEVIATEASSYGLTAACRTGKLPIVCNHEKFCFRRLSSTPCQDTPFLPEQPMKCLQDLRKYPHQKFTSPENHCGHFKWNIYMSREYADNSWDPLIRA